MFKKPFFTVVIFVVLGVAAGLIYTRSRHLNQPSAGLKVDSTPPSLVFVNNVQMGRTPFEQMFKPGDITVKLIPESSPDLSAYETQVHLTDKVYTVIKREFAASNTQTSGEIISLLPQAGKSASLSVITSDPDSASVALDGEPRGFSPLTVDSLTPSDHQVEISAPGFSPRTVSFKAVTGYLLTLTVKLAASVDQSAIIPAAFLTPSPTSTPSAQVKTTPTSTLPPRPYVTISTTPTRFLRVRSGPSTTATEIGRVNPGESYSLLSQQTDWYLISGSFTATSSGWISATYAEAFK